MAKIAYVFCERSLKQRQGELNRSVVCVCIQHSNKLSVWAPSYWIFWKYAFLVMADVIKSRFRWKKLLTFVPIVEVLAYITEIYIQMFLWFRIYLLQFMNHKTWIFISSTFSLENSKFLSSKQKVQIFGPGQTVVPISSIKTLNQINYHNQISINVPIMSNCEIKKTKTRYTLHLYLTWLRCWCLNA